MADTLDQQQISQMVRAATESVFSTMLNLPVTAEEAFLEQALPEHLDGVVSFIGMTGTWVGTGSLCCSSRLACSLSSSFLMTELTVVDEEVLDAIGELTNMIIGNVKNEAELLLGPMGLSIPTVIHGRNFAARSLGRGAWTVVPFKCGEDRLDVKVCLAPENRPHHDRAARPRSFILP